MQPPGSCPGAHPGSASQAPELKISRYAPRDEHFAAPTAYLVVHAVPLHASAGTIATATVLCYTRGRLSDAPIALQVQDKRPIAVQPREHIRDLNERLLPVVDKRRSRENRRIEAPSRPGVVWRIVQAQLCLIVPQAALLSDTRPVPTPIGMGTAESRMVSPAPEPHSDGLASAERLEVKAGEGDPCAALPDPARADRYISILSGPWRSLVAAHLPGAASASGR